MRSKHMYEMEKREAPLRLTKLLNDLIVEFANILANQQSSQKLAALIWNKIAWIQFTAKDVWWLNSLSVFA